MYTLIEYLKRNWGIEYENEAILVAIAVNEDGKVTRWFTIFAQT